MHQTVISQRDNKVQQITVCKRNKKSTVILHQLPGKTSERGVASLSNIARKCNKTLHHQQTKE